MKKILLANSAFVMLAAGSAGAADLAVKAVRPVVAPPACAQFGGFYAGIQGGGLYYQNTYNDLDYWWNGGSTTTSDLGWHGGVQGGYNWQTGCTVFGVMADYSWSNAKVDTLLSFPTTHPQSLGISSKLDGFGTLRARTGLVVQNLLLYVSGGIAFARFDRSIALQDFQFDSDTTTFQTFDHKKTHWGLAAGAGTEWSITPNLSLMGEFVLMGFKKHDETFIDQFHNCSPCEPTPFRFSNQDVILASRIGLNYRFGGGGYYY